jgi:hypothetical protein
MRTRAAQIAAIRADQEFWRQLAAEVGPWRYDDPGPMGDWTFGDLAGHLVGWRNRTLARLDALARDEPEPAAPWPAVLDDDDRINGWIREQHADRSAAQLVAEYDASYGRLADVLESLSDEKLALVVPWLDEPLVAVDFTAHLHDEHAPAVRAWLDGTGT